MIEMRYLTPLDLALDLHSQLHSEIDRSLRWNAVVRVA